MANLWPCPLWQHPPPPLTPVLEDNLARTRLPTASCLIGSPCTQTQGGNCSTCTLWFKSGPWFSFVIDSVLWDERRESWARLCGWLISQCLVDCGCISMFGLLQACWGDAHGCYFWIPQNAWCVSVPRSLERHLSKMSKNILNLKLCYFNLFYLTSFSISLCYICHVLCRFDWMSKGFYGLCPLSEHLLASEEYVLPFV